MGRGKLVLSCTTSYQRATWLHQVPATRVAHEPLYFRGERGESGAGVSTPAQQAGAAHKPPFTMEYRYQPQLNEIYLGCFPWGLNWDVYPAYLRQSPGGKKKEKEMIIKG